MLDRLKQTLSIHKDEQGQVPKINADILSLFEAQQIKASKKTIQNLKETLSFLEEIANTNKQAVSNYVAQQVKNKLEAEDPDEKYTFLEDLAEIKSNMGTVISNLKAILDTERQIHSKVDKLCSSKVDDQKYKALQTKIQNYQDEIKRMQQNQSVQSELLTNTRAQTGLLNNEIKDMVQKVRKAERELAERVSQVTNLQQEKKHLLNQKNSANPEVQAMRTQMQDFQKRMNIEKTKTQQKQKQIQQLKKKIEEQKNNMMFMADELKSNSLKSQKMTQKYQNSKVEIRKFRQQKLQEVKKLSDTVAQLQSSLQTTHSQSAELRVVLKRKEEEIVKARTDYQNARTNSIKQTNLEQELKILSNSLRDSIRVCQQRKGTIQQLEGELSQMKHKRQSLLQLVEQPTKHQIHNLDKIHKQMQVLYKDYVIEVFDKKNIIGFQRKIKDVMANVMQLREDLIS